MNRDEAFYFSIKLGSLHLTMPSSYCQAVRNNSLSVIHRIYHDKDYGFPALSDQELFGKMLLEINQAGLSWQTILNKKESIKAAYWHFDIHKVAAMTQSQIEELLQNPGIIRMRRKIEAAIYNAKVIQDLQDQHGSFMEWLNLHHPMKEEEWAKLFKKTFRFMGKEITKEFLMSTGYLKGAHDDDCPIQLEIIKKKPKWLED